MRKLEPALRAAEPSLSNDEVKARIDAFVQIFGKVDVDGAGRGALQTAKLPEGAQIDLILDNCRRGGPTLVLRRERAVVAEFADALLVHELFRLYLGNQADRKVTWQAAATAVEQK